MPKWVKMFVGILLIPVCLGACKALWFVLTHAGAADQVIVPLLAGIASWIVIFILLPKPMWIYVFGHEMTHAIWTWLFGGKVTQFKASSEGGQVAVTKNNFVIALAPYFFPFYAAMVVGAYSIGNLIWSWQHYRAWFHLLLGASYAFHLTLTWHILKTRQSDVTQQGYIFSAAIIFLGNALVLMLGIPLLTGTVGPFHVLSVWIDSIGVVLRHLARLFQ